MPEYRRYYQRGGCFFFTLVTEGRAPLLCAPKARPLLHVAIQQIRQRWPFTIDAFVLLPDHLHTIWTLPEGDTDYSRRWALIKKTFTQSWLQAGGREQLTSDSRRRGHRRGVWQRRFWEHLIRDERDFEKHCDYIHFNPVKHEVASCPHAWPHSTFDRFVCDGHYPRDWCCRCSGRPAHAPSFDGLDRTAME